MEFIKTIDAIKWKDGNYEKQKKNCWRRICLLIYWLPTSKKVFSLSKNLDEFAIGYCLGEGLIKINEDIEEIKVSKTNVLVKTRLNHTPEEDLNRTI